MKDTERSSSASVWQQDLGQFRDALAHQPMPGCGSASSVVASMGLALILKGLYLSQKHEASEVRAELMHEGENLKHQLAPLADEDVAAFEELMAALNMPQHDDEQKAERRTAVQAAATQAVEVPLQTARLCRAALELGKRARAHSEEQFSSDTQAGGRLLAAALRCVLLNVVANIDALGSEAEKRRACEAYAELEQQATALGPV